MQARLQSNFSAAATDFRASWKQLLLTDLAFKAVYFTVLAPISGLVLRAFLFSQGTTVIADTDILWVALSPIGLLGLILVAAVGVAIIALEMACLMVIGFGATHGLEVRFADALWHAGRKALSVLRLTVRLVSILLLIAAPFLAAAALVAFTLLTEFDINFYLKTRPPAFWLAAVLIGTILGAGLLVLVPRVIGWAFGLPLLLFEGTGPSNALQESAKRTEGNRAFLAIQLVGWALASMLAGAVAFGGIRLMGAWVAVPLSEARPALLLVVLGGLVMVWAAVNEIISLMMASGFALLTVRSYDAVGEPKPQKWWKTTVSRGGRAVGRRLNRWQITGALLITTIVAAAAGAYMLNSVRLDTDVQIIAHRGAARFAPENTLAAFERAIVDGADWIELDVLETADGEVVVAHDRDLKRVGGVSLPIETSTYEQLQAVDVGSWFGPEFAGERVPLLEEALELCKGRIGVVIELKYLGRAVAVEARVVEIVEAADMAAEVVVMSLNYGGVQKMRSLRPDWRLGLITAVAIGNLTTVDADFLAVNGNLATALFIRQAHVAGIDVYVWPIYERLEKARMISRGADGLITYDPALGRRLLAQLEEMTPVERLMLDVALLMGVVPEEEPLETNDLEGEIDLGALE
jgi:glycerophosphoryl diester phosphodiesterase